MLEEREINSFLNVIRERFSFRGKYEPTPVPRKDLEIIIEAGLAAPSGCNAQTTSLIAVDDLALIQKLGAPLGGSFATAPAAIVVLTQPIPAWENNCYNVQDYSAAIENILLTVTALGYASCWVEGWVTGNEAVSTNMRALLGVPDEYQVVAYLPVGVAAEAGSRVKKKPKSERAWFNGFRK